MTDRELIESAAKAAGFAETAVQDWAGMDVRYGYDMAVWTGETYWNPLKDDGDALRLAVKLGLMVDTSCQPALIQCAGPCGIGLEEPARTDAYAATRRAIVRAAAAMNGDGHV